MLDKSISGILLANPKSIYPNNYVKEAITVYSDPTCKCQVHLIGGTHCVYKVQIKRCIKARGTPGNKQKHLNITST